MNNFEIRRGISGFGLFAKSKIAKNSFVIEYTGEKITTAEADKRGGRYLFRINNDWTIDGKGWKNFSRYINHSCDPNCVVRIKQEKILIFAQKDVLPGEELFYDYGKEYFDEYIKPIGCKCHQCNS